jgi:hypothetical protein
MKRTSRFAASMAAATLLVSTAACSSSPKTTAGGEASWAEHYNNLKDLGQHSDLVVSGTFSRISNSGLEDPSSPVSLYTNFEFTVSQILQDKNHKLSGPGATITIHQLGGTLTADAHEPSGQGVLRKGSVVQTKDDPLYTVGEKALLYLRQGTPGIYFAVGGPNGRYKLVNGSPTPLNSETVQFSGTVDAMKSVLAQ